MKFYDIPQHIQYLKQEIQELSEETMSLDPDHPDVDHLLIRKDKAENELNQILDLEW